MRRVGLFTILVTLAAACGADSSPTEFAESVVGVEASGCSLIPAFGSGAVLDDQRVVTSAHIVAGATTIEIIDSQGERRPADLVGFDPRTDLAVLSVPGLASEPLPIGRADGGEPGWVLTWSPGNLVQAKPMTVTKRILVTIEDIYVDELVERRAIELDADISHGDSGAAVVTTEGDVVGIIYATSRSRAAGFALNGLEIAAALDGAGTATVDPGPCI
jgi:S1-C subfamily serine protease